MELKNTIKSDFPREAKNACKTNEIQYFSKKRCRRGGLFIAFMDLHWSSKQPSQVSVFNAWYEPQKDQLFLKQICFSFVLQALFASRGKSILIVF